MAVKIRLQRGGSKGHPMYRMVVAEAADKRDGRFVEILGTYDPKNKIQGQQIRVDIDRANYWLGVGAQASDTARSLINRAKREAAARGDSTPAPKAGAAEKEAKEVANKKVAETGNLAAGGTGATGVAPTEASE